MALVACHVARALWRPNAPPLLLKLLAPGPFLVPTAPWNPWVMGSKMDLSHHVIVKEKPHPFVRLGQQFDDSTLPGAREGHEPLDSRRVWVNKEYRNHSSAVLADTMKKAWGVNQVSKISRNHSYAKLETASGKEYDTIDKMALGGPSLDPEYQKDRRQMFKEALEGQHAHVNSTKFVHQKFAHEHDDQWLHVRSGVDPLEKDGVVVPARRSFTFKLDRQESLSGIAA
eukprot:Tamp_10967.p2 GENE.Tamp_10967~~Tamp_10967.p2  ORF type:complete len:228 (+),score=29.61 Tamp_10967:1156-1839(+)